MPVPRSTPRTCLSSWNDTLPGGSWHASLAWLTSNPNRSEASSRANLPAQWHPDAEASPVGDVRRAGPGAVEEFFSRDVPNAASLTDNFAAATDAKTQVIGIQADMSEFDWNAFGDEIWLRHSGFQNFAVEVTVDSATSGIFTTMLVKNPALSN